MKHLFSRLSPRQIRMTVPYAVAALLATNLGQAFRMAPPGDVLDRMLGAFGCLPAAFENPLPSLHPFDLLVGAGAAGLLRLVVYTRTKNAKKYRRGMEYGSARWSA